MPCAYVIVDSKISDPERFKQYMAAAPAAVAEAGGEYLVRGGALAVLEGDWAPARITVLRFPSLAQAQAFYASETYRAAILLRTGTTDRFNMIVAEGVPDPI